MKNIQSNTRQAKRALRVSSRVLDRSDLPRLVVKRSNQHLHAQIIDRSGKVLAAASSLSLPAQPANSTNLSNKTNIAKELGVKLAELAKKAGLSAVVLDRGEYRFHGRIKALVESLNTNGLKI
ncbi:50S ribosomal protein L18 [Candidatus Collierbacteria bacterium]|nr:50S ribosomal protein L18 [Candidatus Collierbacteria bacterium]